MIAYILSNIGTPEAPTAAAVKPSRVVNEAGAALAAFNACRRCAAIQANAITNTMPPTRLRLYHTVRYTGW